MYNRSPSRSNRSKGFKVKHILQICVLIVVCFWLVYQIKHSHEKKKEFDEKDVNLASETQNGGGILRLGRKDISRMTEIGDDGKLHGEDEEENEADEEENKRDNEQEREANRAEDRIKEHTGKGDDDDDDEVDIHQEEKTGDGNHEEELVDEEKEKEEGDEKDEDNEDQRKEGFDNAEKEDNEDGEKEDNEDGEREDNKEGTDVLEDQDDGATGNTHEAREEQYKADDASSEVTHDAKTAVPANATIKHTELISDGKENLDQSSNHTLLEENSDESTKGAKSNAFISAENSTSLKESYDEPLNLTQELNATNEDSHGEGSHTPGILLSQTNTSDLASDRNHSDIKTQHVNTTSEGSLANNITGGTGTKADDMSSADTGADDENNGTADENEISTSESENDNQVDHVDDFDSSLTQEEKDYRMDLGTLPDIKIDAQSAEDVEAE